MYIKKVYIMWKKDYVYMYDILCICTSASYERWCVDVASIYSDMLQRGKRAVSSKENWKIKHRTSDYLIKSVCWDLPGMHLAKVGMTYQNHTISDLHQWMLPMCQDLPITSKLKQVKHGKLLPPDWRISRSWYPLRTTEVEPHFKDQRSTERNGKLHASTAEDLPR